MKIAFVSDAVYPWHVGGIETVERTEAEELAKRYEVHFLCMRWPGMHREFIDKGITYHARMSMNSNRFYSGRRRSIRQALFFTFSVLRIFKYRFDYIEANMFPILHLPILKLYCKLTGCKLILDVVEVWSRDYWISYLGSTLGSFANWYASFFLGSANAYIANSSATAHKLAGAGINRERIREFAPLIDDKSVSAVEIKKRNAKQIIFSGRLIKEKRMDKWLSIVKEVSKRLPGVKGVIIGMGPEKENIENLIKSMDLSKIVELRDFYDKKEDLYRELKSSGVFLLMSEREGLSVTTLENLSLGTPVMLPSYSPIPDEVKQMCVVEPEDKIAQKLIEMLKSKDKDKYIKNKENLAPFSISHTQEFYSKLFEHLK